MKLSLLNPNPIKVSKIKNVFKDNNFLNNKISLLITQKNKIINSFMQDRIFHKDRNLLLKFLLIFNFTFRKINFVQHSTTLQNLNLEDQ